MGDNKTFLSGPYSEILEGCDGTSEFPEDWEEGTMEYKTFQYNEEEEFANLTRRPIEDPAVERKEFTTYKTSKKDLVGSAHLALSYLRTIGDDILLAPSCVGEEARNIIEDEISSGKIKKLVKCKVSRAMVGAMCQHFLGAKNNTAKKDEVKRIRLFHFKKRPFNDTDDLLDDNQTLGQEYKYEKATIDEIITSALLFAALYGAIYGKWHEEYLKRCVMEMKKFYTNLVLERWEQREQQHQ